MVSLPRYFWFCALACAPVAAPAAPAKTPPAMPATSDLNAQLSRAIAKNDAAAVAQLMKRGARPDEETLYLAIYGANLTTWRALFDGGLSVGARVDIGEVSEEPSVFNHAPLIVAVAANAASDETQSRARALLRELLARGADANARGQNGTTALQAATHGAYDGGQTAQMLLDAGARVAPDDAWLLQSAARMGNVALLKRALQAGVRADSLAAHAQHLLQAALDIRRQSLNEDTPVFEAQDAGARQQIAELLLDAGAPVNDFDELGQTPLMLAADGSLRPDAVELLLKHGADPNLRKPDGPTIWNYAVPSRFYTRAQIESLLKAGDDEPMLLDVATAQTRFSTAENTRTLELLLNAGASLEQTDASGATPLMLAARNNRAKTVAFLLARGADPEATDKTGNTALHVAAGHDSPDAVAALLDAGAAIEARNQSGLTPLLSAAGAGLEGITYYGPISMMVTGYSGGPEALRALVMHGAALSATDRKGATALHHVAKSGDTKNAQLLIRRGANVNARAADGVTALHIAASQGDYSMAKLLLQLGADASLTTADGQTALLIARTPYRTRIDMGDNPSRETRQMVANLQKNDAQITARRREIARLLERQQVK